MSRWFWSCRSKRDAHRCALRAMAGSDHAVDSQSAMRQLQICAVGGGLESGKMSVRRRVHHSVAADEEKKTGYKSQSLVASQPSCSIFNNGPNKVCIHDRYGTTLGPPCADGPSMHGRLAQACDTTSWPLTICAGTRARRFWRSIDRLHVMAGATHWKSSGETRAPRSETGQDVPPSETMIRPGHTAEEPGGWSVRAEARTPRPAKMRWGRRQQPPRPVGLARRIEAPTHASHSLGASVSRCTRRHRRGQRRGLPAQEGSRCSQAHTPAVLDPDARSRRTSPANRSHTAMPGASQARARPTDERPRPPSIVRPVVVPKGRGRSLRQRNNRPGQRMTRLSQAASSIVASLRCR